LTHLARGLNRLGVELVSTGGTLKFLAEEGLPVTPVSAVTGFPEILEGRVKTLHPRIHAASSPALPRSMPPEIAEHGILPIDLVVVNLYPSARPPPPAPSRAGDRDDHVGGPAMLRARPKNSRGWG